MATPHLAPLGREQARTRGQAPNLAVKPSNHPCTSPRAACLELPRLGRHQATAPRQIRLAGHPLGKQSGSHSRPLACGRAPQHRRQRTELLGRPGRQRRGSGGWRRRRGQRRQALQAVGQVQRSPLAQRDRAAAFWRTPQVFRVSLCHVSPGASQRRRQAQQAPQAEPAHVKAAAACREGLGAQDVKRPMPTPAARRRAGSRCSITTTFSATHISVCLLSTAQ